MTDMTELKRSVRQVIPPNKHDDYTLSEPFRAVAEGKYIVTLEETAAEKDGLADRLLSLAGVKTLLPPPTVLLESGTDDIGRAIRDGVVLRVRGDETYLENVYDGDETQVVAQTIVP